MQQPLLEHRLVCGRAVVALLGLGCPGRLPGDSFHPDPLCSLSIGPRHPGLAWGVYHRHMCSSCVPCLCGLLCGFPGWALALFCGQLVPSLISGFVFTRGWICFVACSLVLPLALSSAATCWPPRSRQDLVLSGPPRGSCPSSSPTLPDPVGPRHVWWDHPHFLASLCS